MANNPPPFTDPFGNPITPPVDSNGNLLYPLVGPFGPNPYPNNPWYQYNDPSSQMQVQQQQGQQAQLQQLVAPQAGWLPPGPYTVTSTGLPAYFGDAEGYHPTVDETHPARGAFYYVNDGPQILNEPDKFYRMRIRLANTRMQIERRPIPQPPRIKKQTDEWRAAREVLEAKILSDTKEHREKLTFGHPNYDPLYEIDWDADKRLRQARNAARRQQALEEVRAHLSAAGYDKVPTPDPADDSGDDLYDLSKEGLPMKIKFRRTPLYKNVQPWARLGFQGEPIQMTYASNYSDVAKSRVPAEQKGGNIVPVILASARRGPRRKTPALWPSLTTCNRCARSRKGELPKCDMKAFGIPCRNCRNARAECVPASVKKKPNGYAAAYPNGHEADFPDWYRDRETTFGRRILNYGRSIAPDGSKRSRSASPRRRSAEVAGSTANPASPSRVYNVKCIHLDSNATMLGLVRIASITHVNAKNGNMILKAGCRLYRSLICHTVQMKAEYAQSIRTKSLTAS
ncbi:uncharacterized protein LY89DRAFT_146060 [Mollisia scopiformis]|uniref:Uncharacterized protein n=1 Tax=Mollisia scopiformis TaxID=149040 RepID=A0A194X0J3_MOLSC|nr:uncharacterized protein LY89DRAFT_146060 [Mollisia scopiformis]KUJ13718.1 hypothetical protein LY89DRAFT_146060 [Mollisia scopiformis]